MSVEAQRPPFGLAKPAGLHLAGLALALLTAGAITGSLPSPWLSDVAPHAWQGVGDAAGTAAPPLQAVLRIERLDPRRGVASVNVTLALLAGGGGLAAAGLVDRGELRVALGGLVRTLPWPPARGGAAAFAGTADLAELEARPPFESYGLPLTPQSAVLRLCSGGGGGGGGDDDGWPAPPAAPPAECTSVALPVRLAIDFAAPGYRAAPRLGPSAAAAPLVHELVIRRPSSQRVLRLMAEMLQWLVATVVAARCAGGLLFRFLVRRILRLRYIL